MMRKRYEIKVHTSFKTLVAFSLFWILLFSVSFSNECPVQEFKQYVEKLDKINIESINILQNKD